MEQHTLSFSLIPHSFCLLVSPVWHISLIHPHSKKEKEKEKQCATNFLPQNFDLLKSLFMLLHGSHSTRLHSCIIHAVWAAAVAFVLYYTHSGEYLSEEH